MFFIWLILEGCHVTLSMALNLNIHHVWILQLNSLQLTSISPDIQQFSMQWILLNKSKHIMLLKFNYFNMNVIITIMVRLPSPLLNLVSLLSKFPSNNLCHSHDVTIFMWQKYFCDSTKFPPLAKNPVWIPVILR